MDRDEALRQLAEAAEAYTQAQTAIDAARERTVTAIVAALRAGARPTEVDRISPFTPTYNRKKAREAGIEPGRSGGRPGS